MERRGFLKKLVSYALYAVGALLPSVWIGKSARRHIVEMDVEKAGPKQLAVACYCRCNPRETGQNVRSNVHNTMNQPKPKPCQYCGCGISGGKAAVRSSVRAMDTG